MIRINSGEIFKRVQPLLIITAIEAVDTVIIESLRRICVLCGGIGLRGGCVSIRR